MTITMTADRATAATAQDTFDHIFGAGFDTYSWWGPVRAEWDQRGDAPHGWSVLVPVRDPNSVQEQVMPMVVAHSILMGAMRRIADGEGDTSRKTREQCTAFLQGPRDADFDADVADEVMQVATLGRVYYG